jgi:hypothetical protein
MSSARERGALIGDRGAEFSRAWQELGNRDATYSIFEEFQLAFLVGTWAPERSG